MSLEKPTIASVIEKRDANKKKKKIEPDSLLSKQEKKLLKQEKSQEVLERVEKKRRLKKSLDTQEEYHSENGSTIFTGPDNLPVETEDYQPSLDDLGLNHILGKEELLPTPEDDREAFYLQEFKTLDPEIIQKTIEERVASGEYTEIPLENTQFDEPIVRTRINPEYGHYRNLKGITEEEIDQELFKHQAMITGNYGEESFDHYETPAKPTNTPGNLMRVPWNIMKRFKNWISNKQPEIAELAKSGIISSSTEPERYALHMREGNRFDVNKRSNYFKKFETLKKYKDHDSKAINDFIENQHRLASSEYEDEALTGIEQAAQEYQNSLKQDQEHYDQETAQWVADLHQKNSTPSIPHTPADKRPVSPKPKPAPSRQ